MFNMFSGGALERFSLLALNVMPYISASIIVQLLTQIVPSLKAIQKEGESGRRRITQWSRIGAIPLAIFQAWGIATALQAGGASQGIPVVYSPGMGFVLTSTAIVMPVFNEDPSRVFEGLRVIYRSLELSGRLENFDFFILSDSNDPDICVAEQTHGPNGEQVGCAGTGADEPQLAGRGQGLFHGG